MRRHRPSCKPFLLLSWLLVAVAPLQARELAVSVTRVDAGMVVIEGLEARLHWDDGADAGDLELKLASAAAETLGYRFRRLQWRCPLHRDEDGWACAGEVRAGSAAPMRLALRISEASLEAALSRGGARLTASTHVTAPDHARLLIERVPVAWVQAFVRGIQEEARLQGGRLDGALAVDYPADAPLRVAGRLDIGDIDLDTPDGSIASAGLGLTTRIEYQALPDAHRLRIDGEYRTGELLMGALYLPSPERPIALGVDARLPVAGGLELSRLRWHDAGLLSVEGSARFDPDYAPLALDLRVHSADLAQAGPRYLDGWLGLVGLPGLRLGGALDVSLAMDGDGLSRVAADLSQVMLLDPVGRFTLAGLDGRVAWTALGESPDSRLAWSAAAIYGIGLGPADFPLQSDDGVLRLAAPVALDVLGGRLSLEHLRLVPPRGEEGTRITLGLALEDLDLGDLSQRLGWPPFTGRVDGRLPAARYADNRLDFDGDLTMQVFDGRVRVSNLAMERPFGIAPTLSADVAFAGVDLQPMTAAFGFGEITGRLQGRIDGLRLLDWTPIAFDARLRSDPDWRGRRRISQRAVEDISSLGGGLVAGLQARMLRVFSSFGYRALGISCRLRDEVCEMDGIDSAGEGYTLVAGAGIPRIRVVGYRRQVDWPTLLDRLKAATEGQMPIIQ